MKRIYNSEKHKLHRKRTSRKRGNQRLRRFRWLKNKRALENNISLFEITQRRRLKSLYWDFTIMKAPNSLSLLKSPLPVLDFIKELEYNFARRKKVFVSLKNVIDIDHCAIVVLLSSIVRFKSSGIGFNGDYPRNAEVLSTLRKSGFFKTLFQNFPRRDRYEFLSERNFIATHAYKRVDAELGDKVISSVSEKLWGSKKRCQGVQRVLLELMHNTHNHADISAFGTKHWWLSVNISEDNTKACFSFSDYGVGVFTSLDNKKSDNKFHDYKRKLMQLFTFSNNGDLLKLILEGKLHETVTGKKYRGKGLPGISMAASRNQISKLHIITNDVFCNFESGIYQIIPSQFQGTLVYWEISTESEHCNED